jgi:hypothetical protein
MSKRNYAFFASKEILESIVVALALPKLVKSRGDIYVIDVIQDALIYIMLSRLCIYYTKH